MMRRSVDGGGLHIDLARELDLDVERFTEKLDGGVYTGYVLALQQEAQNLSLPGTPSVILDQDLLTGDSLSRAYFIWDAIVQVELLEARQHDSPSPMTIDEEETYYL
jgi:predicted DsbA family dithiol-disulfide isomerase